MNSVSLQVLLVEDNPTDVLLMEEALEEARATGFKLTNVSRLDEALALLDAKPFDVVLLDLGLPDSQGIETFVRLQSRHPRVPVLVLSGLDDETIALQAVQAGAQDYLFKGVINCRMLVRTIRYAIERKRSDQRVMASEASYRRLFETARDGIFILDAATGQITDANPYLETLLGHKAAEFVGKRLWEIAPFRGTAASHAAFRTLQEKAHFRYDAVPLTAIDGEQVYVEFTSNIYEVDGRQVIQCNIRDITERRQAENNLQRQAEEMARSNDEMARFNRLAVGRELRMVELKIQINDLSRRLGRPRPYKLAFLTESGLPEYDVAAKGSGDNGDN